MLSTFSILVKDECPESNVDDAAGDVDGKGYFHYYSLFFTKEKNRVKFSL